MNQDDPYTMKNPIYRAYIHQRNTALRRAIGWRFIFDIWVRWWEDNLGPNWFELRGRKRGQYVMARKNDEGPYALENVECVTVLENTKAIRYFGKIRCLNDEQVKAILLSRDSLRVVAKEFDVDPSTVARIRKGQSYKWVERNKGDAI